MDYQRKNYPDQETHPKKKYPPKLLTHNVPTDEV